MKVLLHACCAPFAEICIKSLGDEGVKPVLFWYNPNIHPSEEYESRKQSIAKYAGECGLELTVGGGYGLRPFVERIGRDLDRRCSACYSMRLEMTAAYAAGYNFDGFSSTLFATPYLDHDLLCEMAKQLAARYHIPFIYRDFRDVQRPAHGDDPYMPKYCGCIFSEEERYRDQACSPFHTVIGSR